MKSRRVTSLSLTTANQLLSCRKYARTILNSSSNDDDRSTSSSSGQNRAKLRITNILENKPRTIFTMEENSTVSEAISHLVERKLSASMVVNYRGEVCGLFTANDILRFMHQHQAGHISKTSKEKSFVTNKEKALQIRIKEFMIPIDKILFCSPNDTISRVRQMMAQSDVAHIPVVENDAILGIITIKDLADSSYSVVELGGKKGFIANVTGRKGVPEGTKLFANSERAIITPLLIEAGSFAMPHPFKKVNSVGANRSSYGPADLCNDMSLCEGTHSFHALVVMCLY